MYTRTFHFKKDTSKWKYFTPQMLCFIFTTFVASIRKRFQAFKVSIKWLVVYEVKIMISFKYLPFQVSDKWNTSYGIGRLKSAELQKIEAEDNTNISTGAATN
ncbi:hypothetical protein C8Q75DRAFT_736032 [Abortiporus biennis]|nr:hypothetical protein C8Q75DRAFT_736032 [Abortiporus biennis]